MPKVEIELKLEQLAQALNALSPGELETLELLLNPELTEELRRRRKEAREELAQGEALSEDELFASE
ncbi:TPA: hypothetical protein EYP12_08210 [Candidatus Bipolaricaulota bacterium]|nr:hypothetical protein [Candidatus Bipolaricaulota bacterium]